MHGAFKRIDKWIVGSIVNTNKLPVLGSDISTLTTEQIVAWYAKHSHATVRALVSRLAYELEKQQERINEAYAAGFKAHADSHGLDAADTAYIQRLSNLSEDELAYLEA